MEHVDKAMENRVWQRVQSRPDPGEETVRRENLKPWILAAQENTAAYRSLSLQLIGKPWEGLRRLEGESSRMTQSLRGICALRGEPVKLTPLPAPREAPRRCLEKALRRSLRMHQELEGRGGDPEYGPVYRSLVRKMEDHCAALTEMLGRLEV